MFVKEPLMKNWPLQKISMLLVGNKKNVTHGLPMSCLTSCYRAPRPQRHQLACKESGSFCEKIGKYFLTEAKEGAGKNVLQNTA
jgi:hypothetical protein